MKLDLLHKIKRLLHKLCFCPIHVYCFHQVSDTFEASSMWKCDWISIDDFKSKVINLQKDYTFISLQEAYEKLNHDIIRFKRYVILTADDGWTSITNIIPWLAEQNIPLTLFINPLYLDGIHKQERESEQLLTKKNLLEILQTYPNVSIASHGWSHVDTITVDFDEFESSMMKAESALSEYAHKISFYAFTYGHYKSKYLKILVNNNLIPVLMDGQVNYTFDGVIHREELK